MREKRIISTQLTGIEGIGETKATKLLREFGSVKGVQDASLEEISKVVGAKAAQNIKAYFSKETVEEK